MKPVGHLTQQSSRTSTTASTVLPEELPALIAFLLRLEILYNQIGEDLGRSRTQPRVPDGEELIPTLLGSQHETRGANETFLSTREPLLNKTRPPQQLW